MKNLCFKKPRDFKILGQWLTYKAEIRDEVKENVSGKWRCSCKPELGIHGTFYNGIVKDVMEQISKILDKPVTHWFIRNTDPFIISINGDEWDVDITMVEE